MGWGETRRRCWLRGENWWKKDEREPVYMRIDGICVGKLENYYWFSLEEVRDNWFLWISGKCVKNLKKINWKLLKKYIENWEKSKKGCEKILGENYRKPRKFCKKNYWKLWKTKKSYENYGKKRKFSEKSAILEKIRKDWGN